MTGQLRDLLEERADTVRFTPPDLDGIVAEGARRVRRRRVRTLLVVSAVAVVVALAAGGVLLLRGSPEPAAVSTGGGLADPVSWSRGSVVHVGPDRVDLGFTVHGFVHTSSGFVVMDGRHAVWSVTDAGRRRVGEVGDQQRLVADRNGTLAAWVGPANELVVYDQLTGRSRGFPDPARTGTGGVLAVDGRSVYWRTSRGLSRVDADTGAVATVGDGRLQLFDAKNSVLAFSDAVGELQVGRSTTEARTLLSWSAVPHRGDEPVVLSPTGRWAAVARLRISGSGDDQSIDSHLRVYDVRTGEATSLDLPGGPWVALPSVWLGDATVQVIGLFGDPPFQGDTVDPSLFTCALPSGSCERAARVGRVGSGTGVATLPDGRWSSGD